METMNRTQRDHSAIERFLGMARNDGELRASMEAARDERQVMAIAESRGCAFTAADFKAFLADKLSPYRAGDLELSDAQLAAVAGGGKSQEAFDILIDHGDELTTYEQVACVWVWLTGGFMAGPNGEGDYRPGGSTGGTIGATLGRGV